MDDENNGSLVLKFNPSAQLNLHGNLLDQLILTSCSKGKGNINFTLRENTFVGPYSIRLNWPDLGSPIRLEANDNVFAARHAVLHFRMDAPLSPADSASDLIKQLRWKGARNLYPADLSLVRFSANTPPLEDTWTPSPDITSLPAWQSFWQELEHGSILETIAFRGFKGPAQPILMDRELYNRDDFRLAPNSTGRDKGKDGRDLGANLDAIGPGAPYHKWRATEDYKKWQQDIRLADKPVTR